jgi:hypothetical protein
MTEENPKLDKATLALLNKKISQNEASVNDYKLLDYYLSSFLGKDYILNKLKENNIYSFEEYILERSRPIGIKNRAVDGAILGSILGSITVLDKFISNEIR